VPQPAFPQAPLYPMPFDSYYDQQNVPRSFNPDAQEYVPNPGSPYQRSASSDNNRQQQQQPQQHHQQHLQQQHLQQQHLQQQQYY